MADRRAECDESIVHDVGGTSRGSRPEVDLFQEWGFDIGKACFGETLNK